MYSPEIQSKIVMWRQKAADGTLTEAEEAEAVLILRGGRVGAQVASDKSRKSKAIKEIPTADDLLAEMGD